MKLEHFKYVVTIAECGSFCKAAEKLFTSQSNLSTSVKNLEEELGGPLFIRSRRGVELTPLGHDYVNLADNILLQIDQIRHLSRREQESLPNLKLSVYNAGWRFVSLAVSELYNRHANLHPTISLYGGWHINGLKFVSDKYCDIGIMSVLSFMKRSFLRRLESLGLQYYKISSHAISISVGPKSPLFCQKSDSVSCEQLLGYPLILRKNPENSNAALVERLGLLKNRDVIMATSRANAEELLEGTRGFMVSQTHSAIEKHVGRLATRRDLVLRNCPLTGECGWIKRKDYAPTALAMELLEIISGYYVE